MIMDYEMSYSSTKKMVQQDNVRMTGFLEKKGKMKLVSSWKKYWFVLEKRLLLYYRSEIEYANLSPCRGSLNMGLVTTVRPGSSSGPCVIHIVTRTQAMQLRAKNRAAQEEWLQALLHSMALPVVPKCLKPPSLKPKFFGHTASLDNMSFSNGWKKSYPVDDWSLARRLNYRKRQISGSYYGGSLDTAIWSKKFKPIRTPTHGFHRGRILERFLESNESDATSLVTSSQKELRQAGSNGPRSSLTDKNSYSDEIIRRREGDRNCKVHNGRNSVEEIPYELIEKSKKMTHAMTPYYDNEVKKTEPGRFAKLDKKDESPLERIKNALSRVPREKLLRIKPEGGERRGPTKKRRQSFLQKVFRRIGHEGQGVTCDSDISDSFYDVISPKHRPNGTLTENSKIGADCNQDSDVEKGQKEKRSNGGALYAEVRKSMGASDTTSPETTIPKVILKIDSIESLKEEGIDLSECDKEVVEKLNEESSTAPLLPPRRVSRPVSPWHDVPTNNAPIDSDKKIFFSHQAVVKFKDPLLPCSVDFSTSLNDLITNDIRLNISDAGSAENDGCSKMADKLKSDDLSLLLEQLTKITVAPLTNTEFTEFTESQTRETEKSSLTDPDYDVPRPHKPINELSSEHIEITSSTDFMIPYEYSEKDSSFHSMEPDSLESTGGKGSKSNLAYELHKN